MLRCLTLTLLAITFAGCNAHQNPNVRASDFAPTSESDYLRVEPALIDRGGSITLSWEAGSVDSIAIEQYFGIKTAYDVRYDDLPAKGTLTIELASSQPTDFYDSQPYIYGATFYLMPSDQTGLYHDEILAHTSVDMRCPYDGFFFGIDPHYDKLCPFGSASETEMDYQEFEKGFMLRRADTGTIYVFYVNPGGVNGPAIQFTAEEYAELENVLDVTPETPAGSLSPDEPFALLVTRSNHALVKSLGSAVAPASRYKASVQDTYGYAFFQDVAYMTSPDRKVMRFMISTYTSSWSYVD